MRRLRAGYAQVASQKNRHRLTRQVAKCPKLRANCAFDNQTAPTTSHLGYRKATQFCRWRGAKPQICLNTFTSENIDN
jgi:predicted site-specific integrase-resolvase